MIRTEPHPPDDEIADTPALVTEDLSVYYGKRIAVEGVNIAFPRKCVTSLIGPSGCGKTTILRSLNRIHEAASYGGTVTGRVIFDGQDIYAPTVSPVAVRRRIGMVFQRANPFPTMSIADDTVSGLRFAMGVRSKKKLCTRRQSGRCASPFFGTK